MVYTMLSRVLTALLLARVTMAADEDLIPQVLAEGDTQPFVVRASGPTAHSRSCVNGTEFIVTMADETGDSIVVNFMNGRMGGGPENRCRSLRQPSLVPDTQVNAAAICIPLEKDLEQHLQVLMALEGVQAIEENIPVNHFAVPWHLDRIDQMFRPLDGHYLPQGSGKGVRVYVVDTGVDARHPEFRGRVTAGYSAVNGEAATVDAQGHGTHCGGLVGARTYGVAKYATVVPIKVFSDRGGTASNVDIIEGINWAIAQEQSSPQSAVLSMSLGMPAARGFYAGDQALVKAIRVGLIPIAAAGNSAKDACLFWPAQSKYAITVGATDSNDYRSTFSNWGSCVDVYAPGTSITSTLPHNRVGILSGTSMATPIVSGVVALYLQQRPTARFSEMMDAILRNAVGKHNVVKAQRMLLVQCNMRTAWNLLPSHAAEAAAESAAPIFSARCWLALAAVIGVVVATLTVNLARRRAVKPSPCQTIVPPHELPLALGHGLFSTFAYEKTMFRDPVVRSL